MTWRQRTAARTQRRADEVISSLPPQCLPDLIAEPLLPPGYRRRLNNLPEPSGALVLYGAVKRDALPEDCPGHLQRGADEPGSLFVSISRDGDGRAPVGQATLIASVFTPTADWCTLEEEEYQQRKRARFEAMQAALSACFDLKPNTGCTLNSPRHAASPVGPADHGEWSVAWDNTPAASAPSVWRVGHHSGAVALRRQPSSGEGTAGVSLSALNVCRQLLAERGNELQLN